ncbi:hypothetical protein [Pedobacter sp. NJ-S-72]
MELIVITHPDYLIGEGKLINALFDAGLQLLHLRKPGNDVVKFMLDEGNQPGLLSGNFHSSAP